MSRIARKKTAQAKREARQENRAAHSRYRAKKWQQEHGKPPRLKDEQQRQKEGS